MKRSRNRSKSHAPHNLLLEEIIGLTTKNGNGLASSISSSKCAYIAGCVVVLYDVLSGTQSHLMVQNRAPKPLSCVALLHDASIIAAGELGHQPAVLVWDCSTLAFICELKCHSYGVACMALSADGKHLVSAGFPRDGFICLSDWRKKLLVAKVKASSVSFPVASIEFSLDNKFIIAAEKNQLKFWKVRWPAGSRASTGSVSLTLLRKVDLGPRESSFVAVTSPRWLSSSSVNHIQTGEQTPIYAVTGKGTLCMVYPGSSVIKRVELEVEKCFAISTSTSLVACACNNGLVKLFGINSLKYAGGLCYVESKRCRESNVDYQGDPSQVELQSGPTVPNAIACQFSTSEKLVVVYDDHSLYVWNVHDIKKATRCCVLVSHSGCIWDIKNVPCENMHDPSLSCVAKGCSGGLSFATCSADGNIRLWDLALQSALSDDSLSLHWDDCSNGAMYLVSAGIFQRDSVAKDIASPGFRAMAVSSDGKHLAAGDCQGNIHIFNLHTSDYIFIKDAHGAEILSLSFNLPDKNDFTSNEALESRHLLASGGQDGKIHLFDVDRNFNLCGSISYHSSAVTVVKVAQSGREILSCGADRSVVIHSVEVSDTECKICCLCRIATTGTIYDVDVDHLMDVAFTVGQDKKINAFDIQSGKLIRWFQHDGDVGDPIKVAANGSHNYLACSYSNRCICIYNHVTGEMVAQAKGHSGVVTGTIFLPDCKHLVSVGADGCIFVWKLPALLSSSMLQRTKEVPLKLPPERMNQPMTSNRMKSDVVDHQHEGCSKEVSANGNLNQFHSEMFFQDGSSPENAEFRFSISRLPKWARYQVTNKSLAVDMNSSSSKVGFPQDYACLELRSPSKDNPEVGQPSSGTLSRCLSETESNQSSPSPPEIYSWASNGRWLTIHTVCMDLLDSPKTCDMKGPDMQGSATDSGCMGHGLIMETSHSNKRIKLSSPDPSNSNPAAEPNFEYREQANLQDAPFESKCTDNSASSCDGTDQFRIINSSFYHSTGKDVDAFRKDSQEHEISKMNFGNMSTELKRDEGKSLTKSDYPSGFLVRRELIEGRKMSLCMHAQDSIGGSRRKTKGTSSSFLPMQPSKSSLEDAGDAQPSSPRQRNDIPIIDSSGVLDTTEDGESPSNMELVNIGDHDELVVDHVWEAENVRSCEEALHNLEAAAENALRSFCNLGTLNTIGEEKSRSSVVQLYAKAAKLLPSVERKIQAIAKLLEPSSEE